MENGLCTWLVFVIILECFSPEQVEEVGFIFLTCKIPYVVAFTRLKEKVYVKIPDSGTEYAPTKL